ncbi:MAG: nitrophenyl compound nitroreductase subunit ArsF family protein [Dehalococcoidia bacterium]|nr:nitrophenyl compound nitroreductase subunit ArsF family protein [Dehalococcoidia bacterium]MDH4290986.1 nitrophenyl compound nitroreductase subunit ArsF family protein [Dehalococcoidia bacterium]
MTKATRNKGNKNKDKGKVPKSKTTRILWTVIPIVLVGLAIWLVLAYGASPATPPASNNSSGPADRVDVVYFHRTQRCYSCTYMEDAARYTVETHFADELASGKVTFQVFNVEEEKNADIVEEYQASYLSLYINTVKDGTDHIEQATDLYSLIGNDEAFVETLKSKIEKSLNGET